MKKITYLLLITGFCLIVIPVLTSCSVSEKAAIKCPDLVATRFNKKPEYGPRKHYSNKYYVQKRADNKKMRSVRMVNSSDSKQQRNLSDLNTRSTRSEYTLGKVKLDINQEKTEFLDGLTASLELKIIPLRQINKPVQTEIKTTFKSNGDNSNITQQVLCDTIVSRIGDVIIGKVVEIGQYDIKYRRCDSPEGPVISVRKSNISVVKYANGTRDFFTSTVSNDNRGLGFEARRSEGLGLAGFVASLVGLFIAGIPLGILSVIFGIISLGKIKRSPESFRGRGFAIASIIIGLVDIVGAAVVIAFI